MRTKLYFILGCTACGKGSAGRELARRIGGQILSVDSMKVYRRMDIGTAKPSCEDRAQIPHHGIDRVEPSEAFSVAEYLKHATGAVQSIRDAGDIPLAVGGTSLYIQAMTHGLFEAPPTDPDLRQALRRRGQTEGAATLHEELTRVDPDSAERIHPNDLKRILRALEVFQSTGRPISEHQKQWDAPGSDWDCVLIGLRREKDDQSRRINARVRRMIADGLPREVENLLNEPDELSPQAAQAVGYAELIEHFRGRMDLDSAIEKIKINTRRLAKKQRTWHRRWPDVRWLDLDENATASQTVERILQTVSFE